MASTKRIDRDLDTTWMEKAACLDSGVEFHPIQSAGYGACRIICSGCPVKVDCLHHALEAPEIRGCWGGQSPRQRARIKRGIEPMPLWAVR